MNKPGITINITSFYDKELSIIQRNAKKLQAHPIMGNVPGIQDQLSFLRSSHRRFIFAALKEIYGEDKARIIIQDRTIKKAIDDFDNLNPKTLNDLNSHIGSSGLGKNLLLKIKHSFYYKDKSPKIVKEELLNSTKDKLPDLVKLPKFRKAI